MNIIIIGPQGSGKGTQAERLAKRFNLLHLESGQILRKIGETDERIRKMLNNGIIVPDEETLKYMDGYIDDNKWGYTNIIYDGYPRKISQYKLLKEWLKNKGQAIDLVIYLDISDDESIRRLSSRRVCEECGTVYNLKTNPPPEKDSCKCGGKLIKREDDKTDTIRKRLKTFHESTEPILKLAEKDGLLIKVDGERPIDVIFEDIVSRIENIK